MVKINSTIFRTIKDEATGATKSIGLFGKSFTELKNILNSIKTKGLFKANVVSDKDIQCIKRYNFEIENGATHQQAMKKATKGASSATKQMIKNANGNTIALNKMTIGAKAANIAMNLLSTAMNMAIMWGISKLITAWSDYKEKLKETAQEASELAEESSNYVQELKDLEKQLEDGTTSTEDLTTAFREQLRTMGYTETQIDSLIEKYGTLADSIKGATKEALTNAKTNANTAKVEAGKSLEAEYSGEWINSGANYGDISSETYDFISETLKTVAKRRNDSIYSGSHNEWIAKSDSADDIYEYYQGLLDIRKKIEEEATQTGNDELYNSMFYKRVKKVTEELKESASLYGDAIESFYKAEAQLEVFNYLKTNDIKSQEAFDGYIEGIKNSTNYSEAYKDVLLSVANDTFPEFSQKAEETAGGVEDSFSTLIDQTKLNNAKTYRDELGKLYDALALLRSGNDTASDIYGFIEEFPGLSEYVGDFELLEAKIQELINERLVLLREQFNGVIGEDALQKLAEYSIRMESITRNIDSTASTINTITSAYQSLNEAIEEYNENGHVSLKTLEAIMKIEPRHLAALLDENGNIKSNTDAYKELVKIELKEYEISARKTYDLAKEENAEAIKKAAEDYGKSRISIDEYQKIIGELGLDDWRVTKKFIDSAWEELEKDPEGFLSGTSVTKNAIDKLVSEFDVKLSHYENAANLIEVKLANAESKGYIATKQYYQTLRGIEEAKRVELEKQLNKLTYEFNKSGLEPNTEAWSESLNKIEETEIAIQESTNAVQDFNNEIRQIDWDLFDFARDQESKFMNEADFMIDLLDSAKMFSEAGEITAEGMATMGLHAQNYNAYLEQSIDYAKELANLQEIYGEDTIDTNVIERRNELLELQQESILSAEAEKDAIIDLVSEGIELQKDAFQGLIDEYTEALDIQKDLYDYQKKNSEQTKKIAQIQKQLAAYSGDQSDEARAKVQQLKVQLDEEQSNLESDQYDRYISDQKEILSTISEDYNNALDAYLDDTAKVISDSIDAANKNASNIGKTVTKATNDVGYEVKYWNDGKGVLASNFKGVNENIQDNNKVLGDIKDNTTGLIDAQKTAITESLSGLTDENSTLSTRIKGILEAVQSIDGKMNGLGGGTNNSNGETGGEKDPTPKSTIPTDGKKEPEPSDDGFNKGAVLKNVTGKWYATSAGTGNSGSTTPEKGVDEWVIDKVNEGSKYPYHIISYKNGKFTGSGWVKKNQLGFKNGTKRVGYDQVAWTQEDGLEYIIRPSDGAILTPVAQNDMVLNAEASKRLWEVSNNPMQFIKDNMSTSIPNAPFNNGNNNVENNIQMTITLPGVSNYQEFVTRLQSDAKFEKMIVDVTSSALTGNSSMTKYRHKF